MKKLFGRMFIQGTGATGEFQGLDALAAAGFGQLVDVPLASDVLETLDAAVQSIRAHNRRLRDIFFVCNSRFYWSVVAAARGATGTVPLEFRYHSSLGDDVLHYCGVPFCVNDFVTESAGGSGTNFKFYVVNRSTVYPIVNEDHPDIVVTEERRENEAAIDLQVSWYVSMVSETDLGLARYEEVP